MLLSERRAGTEGNMKKASGLKIVIIGIILAALVVGYFYYLSSRREETQEEVVVSTKVQAVLLRDLEKNYPPSPKEVVKYFNEISECFYGENYTEEELFDLAIKIQGIYDDELVANKTEEEYIKDLKNDVAKMKQADCSILSYQISASTDVEFFVEDGDSCARLYCNYSIRQGTGTFSEMYVFILRRDEDKHWKILGWEKSES